jgi:hypothetical protein
MAAGVTYGTTASSRDFIYNKLSVRLGYNWNKYLCSEVELNGLIDRRDYKGSIVPDLYQDKLKLASLTLGSQYTFLPSKRVSPLMGVSFGTGLYSSAKNSFVNSNFSQQTDYFDSHIFLRTLFHGRISLKAQYRLGHFGCNIGVVYNYYLFKFQLLEHFFVAPGEDYGYGPIVNRTRDIIDVEGGITYFFQKKE